MKGISSILFVIYIGVAHYATGQNKTYLGFEGSITNDIYKITDTGNELESVPLVEGTWGFNIRQEIGRTIFLETAFIRKYYDEGYGFKSSNGYGSSDAFYAWIIPVRVGVNLNLYKDIIRLVPVVGYSFCINSDYDYGNSYGYQSSTNNGVTISSRNLEKQMHETYSLLQTGLGIEFKIFRQVIFTLSTNYYAGFQEVIHLDIFYQKNNEPPESGTASSKGQFWSFGASLQYPISNLWSSKK